jgi:gamma-glutamylcyclotransferase (GGCT)/AIG2-like uncharacterized protein YtfP
MTLYFAYGSNMSQARMRYRVPRRQFHGVARLAGFRLRFHKRSTDGSAKCNVVPTKVGTDNVFGVVFEIPMEGKTNLDRAEGLGHGYHEKNLTVLTSDGSKIEVYTYIADASAVDSTLKPYSWYKDFVLTGATENRLPQDYIDREIKPVIAIPDPDKKREKRRRAEIRP